MWLCKGTFQTKNNQTWQWIQAWTPDGWNCPFHLFHYSGHLVESIVVIIWCKYSPGVIIVLANGWSWSDVYKFEIDMEKSTIHYIVYLQLGFHETWSWLSFICLGPGSTIISLVNNMIRSISYKWNIQQLNTPSADIIIHTVVGPITNNSTYNLVLSFILLPIWTSLLLSAILYLCFCLQVY